MRKRGLLIWAAALAAAAAVVAALPQARYPVLGWLRGERTYEGWPAGYWVYASRNGGDDARAHAAFVLGEFAPDPQPGSVPALLAGLQDPTPLVRQNSANALGRVGVGAPGVAEPLTAALTDRDFRVRRAAATALGELVPEGMGAVGPLTEVARKDADLGARLAAIQSLGRLGPRAAPAVPALVDFLAEADSNLGSPHQASVGALKGIGPEARPALVAALAAPQARTRQGAVEALLQMGPASREAVPAIAKLLEDADVAVRLAAAEAVWRLDRRPQTAVAAATRVLREAGKGPAAGLERAKSVYLLGEVGPEARSTTPALLDLLKDRSQNALLRVYVIEALAKMGPDERSAKALAAAREDEEDEVRLKARELLDKVTPGK